MAPAHPGPSMFSRKTSLFGKKGDPSTLHSSAPSVLKEEEDDLATSATLPPVTKDEASSSFHRTTSLHSHQSKSSVGSINYAKTRGPSNVLSSNSPIRGHRASRSVSANAASVSPQKAYDDYYHIRGSPIRGRGSTLSSTTPVDTAPKTPFSMSFAHNLRRQDTDRPPLTSHASTFPTTANPPTSASAGLLSPVAVWYHIQDTALKRMATLEYLRKVHEGNIFYFGTVSYNSTNLTHIPSLHPSRLGRRAASYLFLGTSLPPLLDLHTHSPADYLRAFAALLAEYDTYQQLSSADSGSAPLSRARMGQMFKSGMRSVKSRRATDSNLSHDSSSSSYPTHSTSASMSSSMANIADGLPLPPAQLSSAAAAAAAAHDFQYLQTPSLPFDPDFSTCFATLADVLIEAYADLLVMLPTPEACIPGVAEAFAKADKGVRKILISGIVNEFGENTRREARTEVAGLARLVLSGLM